MILRKKKISFSVHGRSIWKNLKEKISWKSQISARKQRYLTRKHYFGSIMRRILKNKTFLLFNEQLKIRKVIKVRETCSWLINPNSFDILLIYDREYSKQSIWMLIPVKCGNVVNIANCFDLSSHWEEANYSVPNSFTLVEIESSFSVLSLAREPQCTELFLSS